MPRRLCSRWPLGASDPGHDRGTRTSRRASEGPRGGDGGLGDPQGQVRRHGPGALNGPRATARRASLGAWAPSPPAPPLSRTSIQSGWPSSSGSPVCPRSTAELATPVGPPLSAAPSREVEQALGGRQRANSQRRRKRDRLRRPAGGRGRRDARRGGDDAHRGQWSMRQPGTLLPKRLLRRICGRAGRLCGRGRRLSRQSASRARLGGSPASAARGALGAPRYCAARRYEAASARRSKLSRSSAPPAPMAASMSARARPGRKPRLRSAPRAC